ncbi:uncharacterized protein LOC111323825 [Stylophora pistillata]|uniref:uncharacterized protein LOC111323825 n=1 Tax=Stylophora pistillata TaxID=50429 RepID=UPI000C03F580|nr:uncharacterized protein LOC111323825 [Stylophora pistillata]
MFTSALRGKWLLLFIFVFIYVSSLAERRHIETHVTCAEDFIELEIRFKSHLWQSLSSKLEMHLAEKYCKPFFANSSHAFIRTSHYECGTKFKVTQNHVIFTKTFIAREETGPRQLVSHIPDLEVGVRCTYNRNKILHVSAPLQLDKLRTSPKEVTTYYGLPVELRCSFKYGAHPVRAVISHRGKIVAIQQNGTQVVTVTVGQINNDFGLYTCQAEDANRKEVMHEIQLKKIDTSTISLLGKQITCAHDDMQLTLDRLTYPWLHPKSFDMHLLDSSCRPYHVNFTHIKVKTKYNECKTVGMNSSGGVAYHNVLIALLRPEPGRLVTRVPDILFPFHCQPNLRKVSSISLKDNPKVVTTREPLTVNKSMSSPPLVKTYKGFDVRLVCMFKGGDPPVNIKLTRRGKRFLRGVEVRGTVLYATIKTTQRKAFSSYECTATDSKGKKIKHKINLRKAGPHDMKSDGLTVKCGTNTMDISLSRLVYPWLQPEKLHISLIRSNCNTYNASDMEIRIQAPLFGCGTRTVRRNKSVLDFRNVVIARVRRPKGFRVTYLPDVYFPFFCRYETTRSAGKPILQPLEPLSADLLMSSANTIFVPPGILIKLKCVFHGGEPPIQVSISRHNVVIARTQGRMLSYAFKPRFQDSGRYLCQATDARKRTVKHVITMKVPARRGAIFGEEAAVTKCDSQFTTVTLHRSKLPWLDTARMRIHLNDPLCQPSHVDNEHVRFKIPLGSCGSRHIRSPSEVIFTNRVLILEESQGSYKGRQLKTLMEVYFLCRYRRIDASSVSQKRLLK